nr:unnamed protein product [Callosobruchus chinensis]
MVAKPYLYEGKTSIICNLKTSHV